MAVGKRHSTADPLTEHDVAERLDRSAVRVLRIMIDAEEVGGLGFVEEVQRSRYTTNALNWLAWQLRYWGIEPYAPQAENRAHVLEAGDDGNQAG